MAGGYTLREVLLPAAHRSSGTGVGDQLTGGGDRRSDKPQEKFSRSARGLAAMPMGIVRGRRDLPRQPSECRCGRHAREYARDPELVNPRRAQFFELFPSRLNTLAGNDLRSRSARPGWSPEIVGGWRPRSPFQFFLDRLLSPPARGFRSAQQTQTHSGELRQVLLAVPDDAVSKFDGAVRSSSLLHYANAGSPSGVIPSSRRWDA